MKIWSGTPNANWPKSPSWSRTAPSVSFEEAVTACATQRFRNPITARPIWPGKPGLWRTLLTAHVARRIAAAHEDVFSALGYDCNPDPTLDWRKATHNWSRIISSQGRIEPGLWAVAIGRMMVRRFRRDSGSSDSCLVGSSDHAYDLPSGLRRFLS